MNERVKELAKQAGMHYRDLCDEFAAPNTDGVPLEMLKRFAELIRLEETKACAKHYLEIMRDAVEQAVLKEREACAKIADDMAEDVVRFEFNQIIALDRCAAAIRQRGEK
jgi:hypothetical protein